MNDARRTRGVIGAVTAVILSAFAVGARAETLCDPAYQDCRTPLLNLINDETVGIDVAFWFMQDTRYETAILRRWNAGVPVRVIVDPKANPTYVGNAQVLADLAAAGIPMRYRLPSAPGILHWKMMLFAGQNQVEFSGANYSSTAFIYQSQYSDYEDEVPYFSDDPSVVNSFKTKYDDLWLDNTYYGDYANIVQPVSRVYPIYTKDPALNFPQQEDYAKRILKRYAAETSAIDAIMYRITDERHTDAMIAALQRGVPVRIISDTFEYRNPSRLWVAYNLDKLYAAGVPLKVRVHAGLNHQKLVIMYGQGMAVFGSSNWTTPSANQQQEHNYFTTKPWMFQWFADQFNWKWNNLAANGAPQTDWFVPLPPDRPTYIAPAAAAVGIDRSLELKWDGGPWGQVYDVYFGTDPNPPLLAANQQLGPTDPAAPVTQKFILPLLQPGTTYYWKIVSKTIAGLSRSGGVSSFTTAGTPPPPPTPPSGANTIVMWTATDVLAANIAGNWQFLADATAAGGAALWNPDRSSAKISPPLASPVNDFSTTFNAMAGVPYHVWVRLRAQNNSTLNNSVTYQFDDAIDQFGSPLYRIGTTQGGETILADPSGTLSGWGWADNGFNGESTLVYFPTNGPHTIQIQQRADGAIVDQIILSPDAFLANAPGGASNDTHIYGSTLDGAAPPPAPPFTPAPPPIPAPWQQQDIGLVGLPGYASFAPGTSSFLAEAAGPDIWGSADAFHFIYMPLAGDGSIVARVATLQNTNAWTKAGVMIRETLAPGAINAFMLISSSKGMTFQGRVATGGATSSIAGGPKVVPYWVRVDRAGNTFTGYRSADGVTWTLVGSYSIPMATNAFVGLALSSHNFDATATATFEQVIVNGTPVCGSVVSPATQTLDASGGMATVSVSTGAACSWTATPGDPSWLTVASGASGQGNGTVTLSAPMNTAGARSTTVSVAGQTVSVGQNGSACGYGITPGSQVMAFGGDTGTIGVTAGSWCSWTASSSDPTWLTVTSGGSGTGDGTVAIAATANNGSARSATITIGDQVFTATQDSSVCSYAIAPGSATLAAAGAVADVALTTGSWCSWTASSSDTTWLTVTSAASGSGNATVSLTATPNPAGVRTATVAIGDQTFTATQSAAACNFAITPASQSATSDAGTATVTLTGGSWCSWTATSNVAWLTVTSGASGSGDGTIDIAIDANAAGARTGTVTIAGQTFTVSQDAAACSYAISPASQTATSYGGNTSVALTTGSWCPWTTTSNASWLDVTNGAAGTGSRSVTVTVSGNTDAARSGTVTIAGETYTVSQAAAPCTYSISPASQSFGSEGGPATVAVTAAGYCSWAVSSNAAWVTMTDPGPGIGSATVSLSVASTTGPTRTGTVTIAGQTFTVTETGPGLPAGWSNQDIGAVGVTGSSAFDGATFSMAGAGADIWGSADAFQFAYQPWTGDGRLIARVTSVQNTNAWAKAGVMIRETLDPGSAEAVMLESYSKGLAFQRRTTAGGPTTSTAGATSPAPYWVRLDRIGNTVTAYQSPDGVMWTRVGSDTIPMAATVYVGLAVSSHTTLATSTATFDNVSLAAPAAAAWMHQDIGAVGLAGTATYSASTGTFGVKGAGADIWGTADGFHYAWRAMSGDGVVIARVATLQNLQSWTKAGVMIRETLSPGSTNALMLVSVSKGLSFQRRTTTGGLTVATAGALVPAPEWVKLERIGDTFNAYSSGDGVTWTLVGSDTIAMAADVYVGLAVTSHTTGATALGTFDTVTTP